MPPLIAHNQREQGVMASAEVRAAYAVNHCFTRAFRMPTNTSDHPSSVSKNLELDWTPSNSINDLANLGRIPNNPSSDRLPDMKCWLHVKSNLGGEASYTCQHLNSWDSELDAFYSGFVDDNVKIGGDQSIKIFDARSCIGSANIAVERPWNVSPKCMKNNNDTRMPKIEGALKNDLCLTHKEKDQGEFWFSYCQFMDCDVTNFLVSEQCKRTSSDLEPHWMGAEKIGSWWHTAGRDELASLVAQKSLEHIENCDLPRPLIKHFRQRPALHTMGVDHDKNLPSSLNQKAETCSYNVSDYTSETLTSGCSFQDSNRPFSCSQSNDSDSSNKDDQINSENNSKTELLKALCHSQTRARVAEQAAQQAYNEKEHILGLFFGQASQLFAYKLWLHLLQLENLCLQLRNKNQPLLNLFPAALPWFPYRGKQQKKSHHRAGKIMTSSRRCGIRRCAVAFAVGLGLVGAGLLLGWTMGWMFPPF